jgi:hypothetical protein
MLSQESCHPELVEGHQFECQYFGKLNMTIKLIFETASSFEEPDHPSSL